MKNIIYMNNKQLIDSEKRGKKVFVIFDDGTEITKTELYRDKILIQCHDCKQLCTVKFYNGLLKREYLCMHCKSKGIRNGFYGKRHTIELKNKLSRERKGKWYLGKNNPMYGIDVKTKMTPEKIQQWKKNISLATSGEKNPMYGKTVESIVGKERWEGIKQKRRNTQANYSKEKKLEISRKLSESQKRLQCENPEHYRELKAKGGRTTMSKACNYKMNKLETKIADWLILHNIKYIYSPIMQDINHNNLQFDFLIKEKRILIECQGTYWHGDPRFYNKQGVNNKRKLNKIQIEKQQKDKIKQDFAKQHDFKLIYIWEYDVNNNNFIALEESLL